jgi:hypothetical protein
VRAWQTYVHGASARVHGGRLSVSWLHCAGEHHIGTRAHAPRPARAGCVSVPWALSTARAEGRRRTKTRRLAMSAQPRARQRWPADLAETRTRARHCARSIRGPGWGPMAARALHTSSCTQPAPARGVRAGKRAPCSNCIGSGTAGTPSGTQDDLHPVNHLRQSVDFGIQMCSVAGLKAVMGV